MILECSWKKTSIEKRNHSVRNNSGKLILNLILANWKVIDYSRKERTEDYKIIFDYIRLYLLKDNEFGCLIMMNWFCGMVDRRKPFSLISSGYHCQRSSPLQISDTPRAGFEPAQNLSSGLVEWSCAVVITTTLRCHFSTFVSEEAYFTVHNIKHDFWKQSLESTRFLSWCTFAPKVSTRRTKICLALSKILVIFRPNKPRLWTRRSLID